MNCLTTVRAVRTATHRVGEWSHTTRRAVHRYLPHIAATRGHTLDEWAITVELLRQEGEAPELAAHRLNRYMTLHAERFDTTPTLKALRAAQSA